MDLKAQGVSMRKKKPNGQDVYVKVKKDLFKDMVDLLYEAEEHADCDFVHTDIYLKKVKEVAEKAEDILLK